MSDLTGLQQLAGRLIGNVGLLETRLFGLEIQHEDFPTGDGIIELDDPAMSLRSTRSEGGGLAYILVVQARVLERDSDDEEAEPLELATLEVAYGALYTSNEEALGGVSDDEARAFGYTVALMTIWPFMRAIIANTIREMNLPGSFVLPMISQSEIAEAAANDGYADEAAEPEAL